MQKIIKLKMVGLKGKEEVYLGKLNVDLSELLNSNSSMLMSVPHPEEFRVLRPR